MIFLLASFGKYMLLMKRVFARPDKPSVLYKQTLKEIESLVINSIGIVIIISGFMGAVLTLQVRYNFESPLIPLYLIGLTARDTMFLEFSSTIVGLILAGKIGSNIASEIGTMRITEQIDALDIMGVNSANHLILPKIIAAVVFNPVLTIISMFVGMLGGLVAVVLTGALSTQDYLYGLHYWFIPFYIAFALIKTVVFAFIITSLPAFHGYYARGGALEVGKASTKGVVISMILILLFDVLLTQMLLAK